MIRIGGAHKFAFTSEYQAMLSADIFHFPQRHVVSFGEQFLMETFGPVSATRLLVGSFNNRSQAF